MTTYDPYVPEASLPPQPRPPLWKAVLIASVVGGVALVLFWGWLARREQKRTTAKPAVPMTAREAAQPLPPPPALRLETTYVTPQKPPVVAPPLLTAGLDPLPLDLAPTVPPVVHFGDPTRAPAPVTKPPPKPVPARPGAGTPAQPAQQGGTPAPAKKPPVSWMKPEVVVLTSPFTKGQASRATQGRPGAVAQGDEGLVKAVVIERPDDPTAVLYRTQPILGELMDAIHSDIPGQVRVLVTSPVTDKLGQRTVLIPQHSVILAMQSGKVAFGDQRLAMGQLEIQFPDGGIATLATSQLADRAGAAGVPADVNNHYGKLLLAAGISALLNVGTQAAVGNSTNYQPTFEQNMARDLGRSVQQTGEKVVNKQLEVPPTLEVPAGTPVTIQLMQNYRLVR